ncbi:MAG: IS4 family transposase, partial [Bryobacteraceae bacterium]
LRIKAFYGCSENAVKTQIWIAIAVCVLVAIARKRLGINTSRYSLLQMLNLNLYEKTPIPDILQRSKNNTNPALSCNQLNLFDF